VLLALAAAIAALTVLAEPRPLAVVDVNPPAGAKEVPTRAQVTVTFSRPLDEMAGGGLTVTPAVDGFVSVAGRRAAFTPRFGLSADTGYTVTLGSGIRDRAGRALARPVAFSFRTRALALLARTEDGLVRWRLGGRPEPVVTGRIGEFAVSAEGAIAYVRLDDRDIVVQAPKGGQAGRVLLPNALAVRDLEWAPGGHALMFLGASGDGPGVPYLVRLDAPSPAVESFGPRGGRIDPASPLLMEALKKSLVEVVYRRESFAFAPDGRAAIVRDQNWDLAIVGFDGVRRASLGAYLAVGNAAPGGEALAVVDVNPADPALRRQVLAHRADGSTRALSPAERDSHSPRFAHRSDRVIFATAVAVGAPRERRFALEMVEVATGVRRRLTQPPAGESDEAPRWSPDDAWVSFRRAPFGAPERGTAWIVRADGGPALPLEPRATDARWVP